MTEIHCFIAERAARSPHQPIIIVEKITWTAQQLDNEIARTCASLHELGIQAGDRVAFIAKQEIATILVIFALLRLRATSCLLSSREPEKRWKELAKRCSATHWIDPTLLPTTTKRFLDRSIEEDTIATMLYTSGSTGMPKIACHTFRNHRESAEGIIPALHYTQDSLVLLSLPLFHAGGLALLFRTILSGATLLLSSAPLHEVLHMHKVTHASIVPTQLHRILEKSSFPIHTSFLLGGAYTSKPLLQRAKKADLLVFNSYGCTEMSSTITLSHEPCTEEAGAILPHRILEIRSSGAVFAKGSTLFQGYWDPQTCTPLLPTHNGWFATNDLAEWTPRGFLYIGRADRQFISGGENIQPEEIEAALLSIDGISHATVVPVHDVEFGQRPIAYVQDMIAERNPKVLQEILQTLLPKFKIPIRIFPFQGTTALSKKDF